MCEFICSETKLTDGALCFRWMTVACPPMGSLVVPIAVALIRALVRAAVNKSGPLAPRAPYVCFCRIAWRVVLSRRTVLARILWPNV